MGQKTYLLGCCAISQLIAIAPNAAFAQTPAVPGVPPKTAATAATEVADIIVTATLRDESLSKVPISIAAATPATLTAAGVKTFGDLSRQVPSMTLTPGINGSTNLSIRGISSIVGAATTGIYIDDTPIQSRFVGASQSSTNPYPIPFDISRVEVLLGPQGTLFGAGSEGGAIRFISPTPSLDRLDLNARTELASTENGAPSYETGIAGGGPLIHDSLGVHLAAYFRRDGGWVDRVSYPSLAVTKRDANQQDDYLLRGGLRWRLTPDITISPSVTYQSNHRDDDPGYSRYNSSPSNGRFYNILPLEAPWSDQYLLVAVNVNYTFRGLNLINVTSVFDRTQTTDADYSTIAGELLGQNFDRTLNLGIRADSDIINKQNSFIEELRLQSENNPGRRLKWVVGFFYQDSKQSADEFAHFRSVNSAPEAAFDQLSQAVFGAPAPAIFGSGLIQPGNIAYLGLDTTRDRQTAGFGQVDFELSPEVILTAGARVAHFSFDYTNAQDGPYNGGRSGSSGGASFAKATPKVGIEYTPAGNVIFYASASEGVRQGGANTPVPASRCSADLGALGIRDVPGQYNPDDVWSYEVGSKGKLSGDAVDFQASLFAVHWNNIQNIVDLNNCGFNFITNLGRAISQGFDLQAGIRPTDNLRLSFSVGYTDAHYSETILGAPTSAGIRGIIVATGNKLPIAPWRATIGVDYRMPVTFGRFKPHINLNYAYSSRYTDGTGPGTLRYDPISSRRDAFNLLNARAGLNGKSVDTTLFVDNILNDHPVVGVARITTTTGLVRDYTVRPRTSGITFSYKY